MYTLFVKMFLVKIRPLLLLRKGRPFTDDPSSLYKAKVLFLRIHGLVQLYNNFIQMTVPSACLHLHDALCKRQPSG